VTRRVERLLPGAPWTTAVARRRTASASGGIDDGGNGDTLLTLISHSTKR
jgi:hypothetical protein